MFEDVPSSIDYHRMEEARHWAETTTPRRPWRADFFARFTDIIREESAERHSRVLELGSGPGFLSIDLLRSRPGIEYVGLDFSAAMHELARARLGPLGSRARLIERNLREATWTHGLGQFECVVTNQAIHELRHKRHASTLHAQVKDVLAPNGAYLVCDHYLGEGGMSNDQLYMTVSEQRDALVAAGFDRVEQVLLKGDLVLHLARCQC